VVAPKPQATLTAVWGQG